MIDKILGLKFHRLIFFYIKTRLNISNIYAHTRAYIYIYTHTHSHRQTDINKQRTH